MKITVKELKGLIAEAMQELKAPAKSKSVTITLSDLKKMVKESVMQEMYGGGIRKPHEREAERRDFLKSVGGGGYDERHPGSGGGIGDADEYDADDEDDYETFPKK
jgi:hypothetical protein